MQREALSSGLGVVGCGQGWRKCCCSNQDMSEEPGGGRLQIWKERGKIKRDVKETAVEFDKTVNAKVGLRQKLGN